MSKPRSEEQQRQYEKRAKRRAIRQLHASIGDGDKDKVVELLTPDIDVNFYYNQESALQIAVCKGFRDISELLIRHGADIDQCNVEGNSLLNMATWRGHYQTAFLLVEHGCELNQTNVYGSTALSGAIYKGHLKIASMLIKQESCGIDKPNKKGQTPLNYCCLKGNNDIARQLINAGADVNFPDRDRKTPLITATENGHTELVKLLIDAGCSLDAKDDHGGTALWTAAKQGSQEIVDALIRGGVGLDICNNAGSSPFHEAVHGQYAGILCSLQAAGCDVNLADCEQRTRPIHTAVRMCCHYFTAADQSSVVDVVRCLLECCDLNVSDRQGWTPLYHAAFGGELEVVKLLLQKNVDVNQVTESLDSLLHAAVFGNKPEIMRLLLQAGCKVNHVNKRRELPLYTAIDHRAQIESIQLLLDAGSELDVCETEHGRSPLFAAIYQSNAPVVKLLINAGANVNQQNRDGDTALWVACSQGHEDIAGYLLDQPNIQVDTGMAHIPLHTAVYHNHVGIVQKLLRKGCNVNKLSDLCTTALYFAAEGNHLSLAHLLIHHGANPSQAELVKLPQRCCRAYRDPHPHLELQPLYCAVKNDNFQLMRLLLMATPRMPYAYLRTLHELVFRTGYAREARLSEATLMRYGHVFLNCLHHPRSLQEECRGVIRQTLATPIFDQVPKLPLPASLQDYVLMKNFLRVQMESDNINSPP